MGWERDRRQKPKMAFGSRWFKASAPTADEPFCNPVSEVNPLIRGLSGVLLWRSSSRTGGAATSRLDQTGNCKRVAVSGRSYDIVAPGIGPRPDQCLSHSANALSLLATAEQGRVPWPAILPRWFLFLLSISTCCTGKQMVMAESAINRPRDRWPGKLRSSQFGLSRECMVGSLRLFFQEQQLSFGWISRGAFVVMD